MRYLLCGSFAYDTILLHSGRFETHLLPEALSRLNVSFGADTVCEEFGGTAGNIAYNAALLHKDTTLKTSPVWPLIAGSLGSKDAPRYLDRLVNLGHDTSAMNLVEDMCCAHAWILTDEKNNQITAFSPGAMKAGVSLPSQTPSLWHLAPELPDTMVALANEAIARKSNFFFDPGQSLPGLLSSNDGGNSVLEKILEAAQGIFVNDYEAALLEEKTGRCLSSWITRPDQFVVRTLGGEGVELIDDSQTIRLSIAKARCVKDPTGCGDAFRAGFIHAYMNNWSLADCARLGAAMGSLAVETCGGQNHMVTPSLLSERIMTCQILECIPHLKSAA